MTTNRTTAGLRDRKKAETRANIARAAVELFVYHGPEHTTIANIAEQAAISTRTLARSRRAASRAPAREPIASTELRMPYPSASRPNSSAIVEA